MSRGIIQRGTLRIVPRDAGPGSILNAAGDARAVQAMAMIRTSRQGARPICRCTLSMRLLPLLGRSRDIALRRFSSGISCRPELAGVVLSRAPPAWLLLSFKRLASGLALPTTFAGLVGPPMSRLRRRRRLVDRQKRYLVRVTLPLSSLHDPGLSRVAALRDYRGHLRLVGG